MSEPFKICNMCEKKWNTENDFIEDPNLVIIGYMSNLKKIYQGLFLFNHEIEGCGSTLAIKVELFKSVIDSSIESLPVERPIGCLGYCLDQDNLDLCDQSDCRGYVIRKGLSELKTRMNSDIRPKKKTTAPNLKD